MSRPSYTISFLNDLSPADFRNKSQDTPLMTAILASNKRQVELCLTKHQENKTLTEALTSTDATGKNAFCLACHMETPNQEIINLLLPHLTPEMLKMPDKTGKTAFTYSMENEALEDTSVDIIGKGLYSLENLDHQGNNVLMTAIIYAHQNLIKTLLSISPHQLKILLLHRNKQGQDALDLAISYGNYAVAEHLVKWGCDIEAPNAEGVTRLTQAVTHSTHAAVQFLLRHGANINARNNKGDTLVLQMIKSEQYHLARCLVEQGADFSLPDKNGMNALAIVKGLEKTPKTEKLLKLMLQPSLKPLPIDYFAMGMEALHKEDLDTLDYVDEVLGDKFLLSRFTDGSTPLHVAAMQGYKKIVNYLVELEGTKINSEDNQGQTPLMLASASGKLEMVKILLFQGANLKKKNKAGKTAQMLAQEQGHQQVAHYIAEKAVLDTLECPSLGLTKDSFIGCEMDNLGREALAEKGYTLIAEYYDKKNIKRGKPGTKLYIASDKKSLLHAFSLLEQAKVNTEFGIIYTMVGHKIAIKCEKIKGQNHIILMDSLGSLSLHFATLHMGVLNHAEALEEMVVRFFKNKSAKQTFFYKNMEARQTSGSICGIYALKDNRKMMETARFSTVIQEKEYNQEQSERSGITIISYRTPPQFMRLAQSYDNLVAYQKEHPAASLAVLRHSKQSESHNMMQYALTPRDGFGIKTPERVVNRHHSPEKPDEPKFIYKNLSIFYFDRKYIHVVEEFLKTKTNAELKSIVEKHNAANLKIGINGEIMTQIEETELLDTINREIKHKQEMEAKLKREKERERVIPRRGHFVPGLVSFAPENHFQKIDLKKSGIITEDDILSEDELFDYIFSQDNPWNSNFVSPSLMFGGPGMNLFNVNDERCISYLKEVAQELRSLKQGQNKISEPCFFSIPGQMAAKASDSIPMEWSVLDLPCTEKVPMDWSALGLPSSSSASSSSSSSSGGFASKPDHLLRKRAGMNTEEYEKLQRLQKKPRLS